MLKISIAWNILRLNPARRYAFCLWASIGKLIKFQELPTENIVLKIALLSALDLSCADNHYSFRHCRV